MIRSFAIALLLAVPVAGQEFRAITQSVDLGDIGESLIFDADNTYDIGSAAASAKDAYIDGKLRLGILNLGGQKLDVSSSAAGSLAIFQSSAAANTNVLINGSHSNSVTGSVTGLRLSMICTGNGTIQARNSGTGAADVNATALSTGDAQASFTITSGQTWTIGADNSIAGDPFKVSASTALGTSDVVTIDTAGTVTLAGVLNRKVTAGITASTTQTQGQGPLTAWLNEVSTVANANDTVTLPTAVAGMEVVVCNNGANTLQIFPASGDNLGAGVDTATTLAAGSNVTYVSYDATNWEVK